jgi:hypothetical protein
LGGRTWTRLVRGGRLSRAHEVEESVIRRGLGAFGAAVSILVLGGGQAFFGIWTLNARTKLAHNHYRNVQRPGHQG